MDVIVNNKQHFDRQRASQIITIVVVRYETFHGLLVDDIEFIGHLLSSIFAIFVS